MTQQKVLEFKLTHCKCNGKCDTVTVEVDQLTVISYSRGTFAKTVFYGKKKERQPT